MKEIAIDSVARFDYKSEKLQIIIRKNPAKSLPAEAVVIDVERDINLYSAQKLKEILSLLIDSGKSKLYLCLEKIEYIDSSGLGVLLGIQSRLKKEKGGVRIFSPSHTVDHVLRLTRLKHFIPVFETLEEAIAFNPED